MAVKVSFKVFIVISLFFGLLFACVDPVSVDSFINSPEVQGAIESTKKKVKIDPSSNCFSYLIAGNNKISNLKSDKYYMIEWEKDDKNPPQLTTNKTFPLYVSDVGGPGLWYHTMGNISRVSGRIINALVNDYTYKILEAENFPNNTNFTYAYGGVPQTPVSVTGGKIVIPPGAGALTLINLDSYSGYIVMAVDAVSSANKLWSSASKTIGSGAAATIPLETTTTGKKVDYVFARETVGSVEFKVLRVEIVSVTNVAVSPSNVSLDKGGSKQFTATVTGDNSPAQTVNWTVDAPHATGTTITSTGLLTVASDETNTTLTVRATSTVDATQSGTATVNVTSAGTTVTSVTVTPATADVVQGKTQPFSATVDGTGNPAQTVTWEVTGSTNPGTNINSTSGLLTVAANETATSLIVKATSTADTSKSGTATVTVKIGKTIVITVISAADIDDTGNPTIVSYSDILNGTKSLTYKIKDAGNYIDSTIEWKLEGVIIGSGNTLVIDKNSTFLSNLVSGTHSIIVTARHEHGGVDLNAYIEFNVKN